MDWQNITVEELLSSLQEARKRMLVFFQCLMRDCNTTADVFQQLCLLLGSASCCLLTSQALQVDWSQPPRPISEFFGQFTGIPEKDKLVPRIKCNLYYYRTNYLLLLLLAFCGAFVRNPAALVALAVCTLGSLCLNDTFATSLRHACRRPSPSSPVGMSPG